MTVFSIVGKTVPHQSMKQVHMQINCMKSQTKDRKFMHLHTFYAAAVQWGGSDGMLR